MSTLETPREPGLTTAACLPPGLPAPVADDLSRPFWEGLRDGVLRVQRCQACGTWQWGPEWICHRCHADDPAWVAIAPEGRIYSWERAWHPVHPALKGFGPYVVVLVELPHAGGIRMLGNLVGDPFQPFRIGDPVTGVFEHHGAGAAGTAVDAGGESVRRFTLLQWQRAGAAGVGWRAG
ncbi:MAG: Zn-ribbon domain-containing OB-fold protein [Burkholderiaceae bacterium]